jgi:hypothetical protein
VVTATTSAAKTEDLLRLLWWIRALRLIRCIPVAHVKCDRRPVRRLAIEVAVRI